MESNLVQRIKSATQVIVTVTALITSVTSLVKSSDKRVEKVSYEALAGAILEIQHKQAALELQLALLKDTGVDDAAMKPFLPVPTSASASPSSFGAEFDKSLKTDKISKEPKVKVPAAAPTTAAIVKPLPSWKQIAEQADTF